MSINRFPYQADILRRLAQGAATAAAVSDSIASEGRAPGHGENSPELHREVAENIDHLVNLGLAEYTGDTPRTAATGATLSSAANIVEDGLQMGWAFFVFVPGTGMLALGLLALTATIATVARGSRRLTALVPAGTLAAVIFYVHAGGPLMFATWLAAAAFAVVVTRGFEGGGDAAAATRRPAR